MSEKKPLIILTGPTAVGKTNASIQLAKAIGGEIISADSMQIYKYMDIGTDKISKEKMDGVPHYLIDELDPKDEFNIAVFQKKAKEAMNKIYDNNHIPMIVGGTGFYIQSVLYDIDFSEDEGAGELNVYRSELQSIADENGAEALHLMLSKVDPVSAMNIHPNNVKRVIRALEYYKNTGECISSHNEEQRMKQSPYNFIYFVLNDNRALLYDRINQRVDEMFEQGLVLEVEKLIDQGYTKDLVSMQGIGYKELFPYFEGEYDLDMAKYLVKRDTRHFAKRQITWFKRENTVTWMNYPDYDHSREKIVEAMTHLAKERKLI
jgi:tRNA dimethylallyltransferase